MTVVEKTTLVERPRFHRFTDPDAYVSALSLARPRFQLGRIRNYNATVTSADLGLFGVGQGDATATATVHGQIGDRCAFMLDAMPGPDRILGGRPAPFGTLYHPASNDGFLTRSTGAASSWVSFSVSYEDLSTLTVALTGHDLAPSRAAALFTQAPLRALRRLIDLGARTAHLVREDPERLRLSAARTALSGAIGEALSACLLEGRVVADLAAAGRRRRIMSRLEQIDEAFPDEPLTLARICGLLGVNARTLGLITHEFVGMGPTQYLRMHRLHRVRRALLRGDPRLMSVGDVAGQYGFWESGRFAAAYRAAFGEAPSETLRHV